MPKNIEIVIKLIKKECKRYQSPIVTEVSNLTKDPFKVLISCVLSLRTKDKTTAEASKKLFKVADTPNKILKLNTKQIEKLVYPVGFYKTKAKNLKLICEDLIKKHNGKVPMNEEALLNLKGVGRKTMGIVMCYGFNKNSYIPVDTHVHRISNRLGWVKTKKPEQTEQGLYKLIPKKHWQDINNLLVTFGQNVCVPVSPFCSRCPVRRYCPRIGVKLSR